jgi:hypothetical protein
VEVSIDGGTTWLPATGTTSWSIDLGLPGFGSYSVISRATTSEGVVETPGAGITAIRSPAVGVCGDDHSKVLSSLAPILLCATGISSEVSGNGHPWIWNCQGDSGTDPTQCSASIRTYGISVTVPDGLGKGDVNADMISNDDSPKSMFCPKSLCSAQYDFGKTVILTATPDPISLFTSWTGHCDNEHCKLEMTGDKAVTANFSRAHSFKIVKSGILDDSLETLMELADPGNEIRMLATELTINNLILSKALTLTGGWNALQELPTTESTTLIGTIKIVETDAVIKNTTVKGMITIQSGSLKVDSLTIRP